MKSQQPKRLGGHPNVPSADDEGTWCTDHQEGNCTEPAHLENPIELGCCIHTRDTIKKNASVMFGFLLTDQMLSLTSKFSLSFEQNNTGSQKASKKEGSQEESNCQK